MNKSYLFIILIIGLLIACLYPQQHIVIHTDAWQCKWATDHFVLQWRHSVEKQLWQDYYQQDHLQLKLSHSYVQSFGAGVPTEGVPIVAPRGFVGMKHDLMLPEVNWIVSRRMQGEIIEPIQQKHFNIHQYVVDYTPVNIRVQKQPNMMWWWREYILHQTDCDELFSLNMG